MTLLTVVKDVCAAVGVEVPTSVFSNITANRTAQEMLALANEMAQRIAYDRGEWGVLQRTCALTADMALPANPQFPQLQEFALPADFKRMLLTANVRRKSIPTLPMRFIADTDEWLLRRAWGYYDYRGEWITTGTSSISIAPPLSDLRTLPAWANSTQYVNGIKVKDAVDTTFWQCKITHASAISGTFAADRAAHPTYWTQIFQDYVFFPYLIRDCINVGGAGAGDIFLNDTDVFELDERLLKLGMIWQWKAQKGTPYAEDMATYEDALARVAGADKPMPIIIGRRPMSAAVNVAYPFPIDPSMVPL
jgi:hypothetical protein